MYLHMWGADTRVCLCIWKIPATEEGQKINKKPKKLSKVYTKSWKYLLKQYTTASSLVQSISYSVKMQSLVSPPWYWHYLRLSCCLAVLCALLRHTLALPDVIKIGTNKKVEIKNSYLAKWSYQTHSAAPTLDYLLACINPMKSIFVCFHFYLLIFWLH